MFFKSAAQRAMIKSYDKTAVRMTASYRNFIQGQPVLATFSKHEPPAFLYYSLIATVKIIYSSQLDISRIDPSSSVAKKLACTLRTHFESTVNNHFINNISGLEVFQHRNLEEYKNQISKLPPEDAIGAWVVMAFEGERQFDSNNQKMLDLAKNVTDWLFHMVECQRITKFYSFISSISPKTWESMKEACHLNS